MYTYLQARIKKIMQKDEDVGKVAAPVPVLICILFSDEAYSFGKISQSNHEYLISFPNIMKGGKNLKLCVDVENW